MCGSDAPDPPPPPATPPPPPPVLEQAAPDTASKTDGEQQRSQALGAKKYRTSLSITPSTSSSTNTGLGISM